MRFFGGDTGDNGDGGLIIDLPPFRRTLSQRQTLKCIVAELAAERSHAGTHLFPAGAAVRRAAAPAAAVAPSPARPRGLAQSRQLAVLPAPRSPSTIASDSAATRALIRPRLRTGSTRTAAPGGGDRQAPAGSAGRPSPDPGSRAHHQALPCRCGDAQQPRHRRRRVRASLEDGRQSACRRPPRDGWLAQEARSVAASVCGASRLTLRASARSSDRCRCSASLLDGPERGGVGGAPALRERRARAFSPSSSNRPVDGCRRAPGPERMPELRKRISFQAPERDLTGRRSTIKRR